MKNDTKKGMLLKVLHLTNYTKPEHVCPFAKWCIFVADTSCCSLWAYRTYKTFFSWNSETCRCAGLLCHPAIASLLDIVRYSWYLITWHTHTLTAHLLKILTGMSVLLSLEPW